MERVFEASDANLGALRRIFGPPGHSQGPPLFADGSGDLEGCLVRLRPRIREKDLGTGLRRVGLAFGPA